MLKRFPILPILFSLAMIVVLAVSWYSNDGRVKTLTVATGSVTGQYHSFAEALSKIVRQKSSNIRLELLPSDGSAQNLQFILQKKARLALVQSDTLLPPSIEVVSPLFPEMYHLIADKRSNIEGVGDLKGKKIALMPKGSGSYNLFWPLSQHYGLKEADFTALSFYPTEAFNALRKGEVDAVFRISALGNRAMMELLKDGNFKLVPIEQAAALQLTLPSLEPGIISEGTYNGSIPVPPKDLPTVAVRALLVADAGIDEETIHELTAILHESRNELVKLNTVAASIKLPEANQMLGLSVHPGAMSFYNQDKPGFLEQYAESMGFILSAAVLVISGIWQLRLWLQNKQKNRADAYNIELVALIEKVDRVSDLEELENIRCYLFDIFEKVVRDLDKDRITPESFQSFRFPWEVALSQVRHRETVLLNSRSIDKATNNRS